MGGRYDYPHYYFLNLVSDAGGGLEHKNSFLTMTGRFTTRTRRAYLGWLGLVAHEYFHNWNIKRLRPIELGPFDYENEVHTKVAVDWRGLHRLLRRSARQARRACPTRDEYLEELSDQIEAVQTTPGRLVTSVDMASFDTWIKQYRPDENTANTTINYYPKGAVIAFLLDAQIRQATGGAKSLDDAMRLAYQRYSGAKGYTLEQFYQTMSDTAGSNLRPLFATRGRDDRGARLQGGARLVRPAVPPRRHANPRAWLGAATQNDGGRLVVSQCGATRRRSPPASTWTTRSWRSTMSASAPTGLVARLEQYRPGDKVAVLVARRDRLTRLDVTLGTEPGRPWRLEVDPEATEAQKQRLAAWIGQ